MDENVVVVLPRDERVRKSGRVDVLKGGWVCQRVGGCVRVA